MQRWSQDKPKARRSSERRAFNLLELVAIILLVGLAGVAAIGRFGSETLQNASSEGYARRLALDMSQARQRTVATGDNHYLLMTLSGGNVASYTVYRRDPGGDVIIEQTTDTPAGVTVVASHTTLEFDFDGAALAAYSVSIAGPNRSWSVTTTPLTGTVNTVDTTP